MVMHIHSSTEGAAGNVVTLPAASLGTFGEGGTVFSGLEFGADGNLSKRQPAGGFSNIGAWLLNGVAGDFTLIRTIDSGTLTTDAGASVTMGADRVYDVQISVNGLISASVTYDIELTSAPGVSLANRTYSFVAIREP